MSELRALTGLRGVAAWWVVAFHLRAGLPPLPGAVEAVIGKGYLAVDLFFLLSGFVIALAWRDRLRREGLTAVPRFLLQRFARVWPLHAAVLAGAALLAGALALAGHPDPAQFPPPAFAANLLLLQMWTPDAALAWNDPAWSISAEAAAYLAFPALALPVDPRRWTMPALVAAIALPLLLLHLAMADAAGLGANVPRFALARCGCEFAAGTMIATAWQRFPQPVLGPALAGVGAAALWRAGLPETLAAPALLATVLLVLAATANRPANPLASAPAIALGRLSYATYLTHFVLWKATRLFVVDTNGAVPLAVLGGYFALVIATSLALHRLVECPARQWLTGREQTIRSSPVVA